MLHLNSYVYRNHILIKNFSLSVNPNHHYSDWIASIRPVSDQTSTKTACRTKAFSPYDYCRPPGKGL